MQSVKDTIRTLDNASVEQIEPGRASNPANVKRVEGILKESDWEYLFPLRADYSYSNFLKRWVNSGAVRHLQRRPRQRCHLP
ncbi:hypothetical protein ACP3P6_18680 [Enterobacter mori]